MDFRQCPACQASVLDDDAADCPFCGASMSSKPSAPAKPAAPSPAKSEPKAQVPAKVEPPKRQAPPRKVGETVADEDDPFGVDTSAVTQVPKVAPKPAKGRMVRITCPMCETPGFISSKMQGHDVKCCNPDCMVPVFQAPRPEKKQADDANKRGRISGKALGIGAAIVGVLTLWLSWGFYFNRQPSNVDPNDGMQLSDFDFGHEDNGNDSPNPNGEVTPAPVPQGPSLAEIKRQALEQIITVAQVRDDNRKPYGRRLAAEAHALAGDLSSAQEQLEHLRRVGSRVPFFQVEPLLIIAWRQHRQGDSAAAAQTIQQAGEAYQSLSQVGRQVLTAGISLAAAQAAFGKIPEAKATLRKLDSDRQRARAASLMYIVTTLELYDLDDLLRYSSLDMASEPLAVAAAIDVASNGLWTEAIAWVNAQPDEAAREEGVSALATFAARQAVRTGDAGPLQLVQGIENLSATGQSRLQAGLATGFLMAGDQSQAEAALARAIESLAAVPKPAAVANPGVKEIHDSDGKRNAGLPNASPLRSAAIAAAQIARLQALLGQKEAAWTTLLGAWDFTSGIATNLGVINQLNDELTNNRARLQAKLNRELNLRNDDERFRALNQYRRQLKDFDDAARERFQIELAMLREAARWGFKNEVVSFLKSPGATVSTAARQPYIDPGEDDRLIAVLAEADKLFDEGKFAAAAGALSEFSSRYQWLEQLRDERAMQLACRLVKQKKIGDLFRFVDALSDAWLAEDVMELTAALGVVTQQAADMWKQYPRYDLQPTEKVAFFRGLISGINSVERQAKPARTAAAAE